MFLKRQRQGTKKEAWVSFVGRAFFSWDVKKWKVSFWPVKTECHFRSKECRKTWQKKMTFFKRIIAEASGSLRGLFHCTNKTDHVSSFLPDTFLHDVDLNQTYYTSNCHQTTGWSGKSGTGGEDGRRYDNTGSRQKHVMTGGIDRSYANSATVSVVCDVCGIVES